MQQQHMQMQQLESEIARLQIELRQVRQLIGSLINTEQDTMRMMTDTRSMNNTNMNFPQGLINDDRRQIEQYNEMRQMADRMNGQLNSFTQGYMNQGGTPSNDARRMNPPYNDPVQRQFQ